MSVDKLMKTMKERDFLQIKLIQCIEERDLKLIDALVDEIKDKSCREKVDLLCKMIETIKNKVM